MGMLFDLHLHTRRYSGDSSIDEARLIRQAVRRGLDGLVITEHHRQWSQEELDALVAAADEPGFTVLGAFEYSSRRGDILIYGLEPEQVPLFTPGGDPEAALALALDLGAACIAAHPTRAAISFDDRILRMPFHAIEVGSFNMTPQEQRLARKLAEDLGLPATASSDAHAIGNVGGYATEFEAPVRSMRDLQNLLKDGRFRPTGKRF